MPSTLRKDMAISGVLSVIQHFRAARWLLYVSSPRVSDIIWYAHSGEINNFSAVCFVLRWLWIMLEHVNPFLQRAYGSNWLEWQCFLTRISVVWTLVLKLEIKFSLSQMPLKSALCIVCFASARDCHGQKNTVWFSKSSMFSSLCSDTNTIVCQADIQMIYCRHCNWKHSEGLDN